MTTATRLAELLRHSNPLRLSAEPDVRLLTRYRDDRDPAVFETLVRRHGSLVLAAARKVLSNSSDVEDVFQATFLVLLRNPGAVRRRGSVGSWLYGVAHRLAVRARDTAARRQRLLKQAARPATRADTASLSWQEACVVLHEELDKLPDKQRLPLLLCYLEGLSRDEAAQRLGRTLATVKADLERGRAKLRQRMERRGVTLSAGLLAAVTGNAASGGPSAELVRLTQRTVGSGASPAVAALAGRAIPLRLLGKKSSAALALLIGMVAAGAGLGRPEAIAPEGPAPVAQEGPADPDAPMPPLVTSTVAGRVVSTDGKPVAGAKVFWLEKHAAHTPPHQKTTTDNAGRFSFSVRHPAWEWQPSVKRQVADFGFPCVTAAGFGLGWAVMDGADPTKLTIIVPPDTPPLTGQLIDWQGRPVAGATVMVHELAAPRDWKNISGWLQAMHAKRLYRPPTELQRMPQAVRSAAAGLVPGTVTDRNGRFTLHGIGRDRVVFLVYWGDTVQARDVVVVNREAATFSSKEHPWELPRTYHGLPCRLVAAPSHAVVGVVRDKDTGRPIPGARIRVWGLATPDNVTINDVGTTSDAQGRFRITGMVRMPQSRRWWGLYVDPPPGTTYFQHYVEVPSIEGLGPIPLDITLKRGVLLTVKVIDKQTRKPVRAYCGYQPLPGNPYFDPKAYINFLRPFRLPDKAKVKLTILPGPGVVATYAPGAPYLLGVVPADLMRYVHNESFQYAQSSFGIYYENTLARTNPGPKATSATVTIELDPGLSVPGTALGPDGRELSGALAAGLVPRTLAFDEAPLENARFVVRALRPGEKRRVILFHPGKMLAGSTIVTGGQKEPAVVTLQPCGEVTGRLVDAAGRPLQRAYPVFSVYPQSYTDLNWGVFPPLPENNPAPGLLNRAGEPVGDTYYPPMRGSAEAPGPTGGRFRIRGLAPGLKYHFGVYAQTEFLDDPCVFVEVVVKPGEVKDLGDVRLVPPKLPGEGP